jgi:hypothetical protein
MLIRHVMQDLIGGRAGIAALRCVKFYDCARQNTFRCVCANECGQDQQYKRTAQEACVFHDTDHASKLPSPANHKALKMAVAAYWQIFACLDQSLKADFQRLML